MGAALFIGAVVGVVLVVMFFNHVGRSGEEDRRQQQADPDAELDRFFEDNSRPYVTVPASCKLDRDVLLARASERGYRLVNTRQSQDKYFESQNILEHTFEKV